MLILLIYYVKISEYIQQIQNKTKTTTTIRHIKPMYNNKTPTFVITIRS